jgi:UDP-N-acetylmuramoyl-L-alanyl-D-glutamate--2,6-diaminopimelate ligase
MKIHLNNHCITDSTQEYEEGCLFLLTTQNKHYYSSQKKITPKQLLSSIDTKFIGITGTNGKTTTAFLTGYILNRLGYSVVVQGTEGVYLNGKKVEEKSLTTPPIISTLTNLSSVILRSRIYRMDIIIIKVNLKKMATSIRICLFTRIYVTSWFQNNWFHP